MTAAQITELFEIVKSLCGVLIGLCIVLCIFLGSRLFLGIWHYVDSCSESEDERLQDKIESIVDSRLNNRK